ncbi:DMT family transporter [Endozoicomonas sp. G2_1]|uniref:DMT family transporter n=1 Tax=Endozoicomonas sp. G2_1 TaxID=2821091 RepID=UPI001ADA3282|nr:DMT family transporter [Endozoicomonas sp. G2_1]MBO9491800.1 DMT family transporter [Endozoicomonas sp. G2_1]
MIMTRSASFELMLLAAIWGASFMFMRIGSPEFGPIVFMALRTSIAALFLLPLLFIRKQASAYHGYYRHIFIVGLFNTAIPFLFYGYATLSLSAGVSSILNATTPMFGAIVAYLWLKDKMSKTAVVGLVVGFIGVYLLVFDKLQGGSNNTSIWPVLFVLGATLCYGISANYTKKYLSAVSPLALATGSQISGSIVLVPLSLFFLPQSMPSQQAIWSAILLGVVCTGIAYILFFRLISQIGPAKTMSVTYLIPAFGVFWGWLILSEAFNLSMLLGCSFILLGVGLTTGVIKPRLSTAKLS